MPVRMSSEATLHEKADGHVPRAPCGGRAGEGASSGLIFSENQLPPACGEAFCRGVLMACLSVTLHVKQAKPGSSEDPRSFFIHSSILKLIPVSWSSPGCLEELWHSFPNLSNTQSKTLL